MKSNPKLKILYIMKILLEKTDEKHPMTIAQLINLLSFYDISAERKAIYKDIEVLKEFGLDIVCEKGRSNQYFVASREFEVPELRMLVDVILSSKFISHKKIRFKYFDYTLDKEIKLRRDGEFYEVSPYGLAWAEDAGDVVGGFGVV